MKHRILHITPDLNYVDGRSYYVTLLSRTQQELGHKVIVATGGGDALGRAKCRVDVVKGLMNKREIARTLKEISRIIDENEIDTVHTHHRYCELLANTVKSGSVKTVMTALSIVDRRYFIDYRSDRIIAVSDSVRKMLTDKFRISESRIVTIPNFADSAELGKIISVRRKASSIFTLFSAARFHEEKDPVTLLEMMKILKSANVKLMLAGSGELEDDLRQYSARNNLNVEFIKPREDLLDLFSIADLCILTSVRDPLPTFLLQSGLHSKVFAGARTDGISEVISDRANGLLFKPRDARAAADAVTFAVKNPEACRAMAGNLHKEVMQKFTEQVNTRKIISIYDELAGGG
ncbi:MAG: glycosyltransferase family 4 protein [Ignavibacteria bacterium]|nr:glycosyltransferase family 4 protein [Ignavibacteria bacterium]